MKNINFYPTLSKEILSKIGCSVNYCFSYFDGVENKQLDFEDTNSKIAFDGKSLWNPLDFDLNMRANVHIKNSSFLYGTNGIAPRHSKLGICLEWIVPKSKRRGVVFPEQDIACSAEEIVISFKTLFKKNYFDNNIDVNFKLYLKESSNLLEPNEQFLNNDEGMILGILEKKEIFVSGQGSLFPIFFQNKPDDPNLWELEMNITDVSVDKLEDSIKLIINSAHKDYEYTDEKNPKYCDRLITEIVSNSLALFFLDEIEDLKQYENEECEDGSIVSYYKYCKNVLGFDFSNGPKLSSSIRSYLEEASD